MHLGNFGMNLVLSHILDVTLSMGGGEMFLYSFLLFLVACTRLYKPLCRSVGPSVRWSVGPSVGPSVRHTLLFFAKWLIELRVRDLWRSALFASLAIFVYDPLCSFLSLGGTFAFIFFRYSSQVSKAFSVWKDAGNCHKPQN